MTFFEQELRKLFEKGTGLSDVRIVGNACYGRLSEDIRVKIHFTDSFVSDNYDALKVVLINRHEGEIDSMMLHFSELWGSRKVNPPNFRDGIYPYIWKDGRNAEWYAYKPNADDYGQLSGAVSDYLNVFREPVQGPQIGQKMC